jgi:hypothetical protein
LCPGFLEQAGQRDRSGDQAVHDLGAHAALADQHALVDHFRDRPAHRRPGEPEPAGQGDLVVEPVPERGTPPVIACSMFCAAWKYNGTGLERSRSTTSSVISFLPHLAHCVPRTSLHPWTV